MDATAKASPPLSQLGEVTVLVRRARLRRRGGRRREIAGVAKVLSPTIAALCASAGRTFAPRDRRAGGSLSHSSAPRRPAARTSLPRVAALLDVMQIRTSPSSTPDTFERPIYAGNALQTVQSSMPRRSITVAHGRFDAAEPAVRPRSKRSARRRPGLVSWVETRSPQRPPELTAPAGRVRRPRRRSKEISR